MFISQNPPLRNAHHLSMPAYGHPGTARGEPVTQSAMAARVSQVAEELEGVFLSMMLKELRQSGMGEGMFPGDHSDTYGGMFDTFMAEELVESVDLGLATLFQNANGLRQLSEMGSPRVQKLSNGFKEYRNEQYQSDVVEAPPG